MHSRDIKILIVLLWLSIVHYSTLFQYFFNRSTIIPTLVEILNFLIYYYTDNAFVGHKWLDLQKWVYQMYPIEKP